MIWLQNYDPVHNQFLSTILALIPIVILLGLIMVFKTKAYLAALIALACGFLITIFIYRMPVQIGVMSTLYGALYGLLPIGWIVLNVIFFFRLVSEKGIFDLMQVNLTGITRDRRLQLLLIAFCFGALLEGAAGFGTPVAITAALLISLGFAPLMASGLSLLANTAPVAFGGLGTPVIALAGVSGISLLTLSGMIGRQLTFFGVLIPIWLIWAFVGWKKTWEVMPAILVAGVSFAITQLLVATYLGPWLVGVLASLVAMSSTILFLQKWQPKNIYIFPGDDIKVSPNASQPKNELRDYLKVWWPWLILTIFVILWGIPQIKGLLDLLTLKINVPFLDKLVYRVPPVVTDKTAESAVFNFSWLSATGTAIFIASFITGLIFRFSIKEILLIFIKAIKQVRVSLLTISSMMAIGFLTRYSGMDATLGLAFARTGVLYPFFGTLLGWLGVALTGSDTSSNVLFGSLQKITAGQTGINPVIMVSANSSGGVMGKMIDAQSIVVASTATKWFGHEGDILRFIILHSLMLAVLVGIEIMIQVYIH